MGWFQWGRAAVLTAGVLGVASFVTPASAEIYDGYCNGGEVCHYRASNYSYGTFDVSPNDDPTLQGNTFYNTGYGVEDRTSSLKNAQNDKVLRDWTDRNYRGGWLETGAGLFRSYVGATFDNRFSSYNFR